MPTSFNPYAQMQQTQQTQQIQQQQQLMRQRQLEQQQQAAQQLMQQQNQQQGVNQMLNALKAPQQGMNQPQGLAGQAATPPAQPFSGAIPPGAAPQAAGMGGTTTGGLSTAQDPSLDPNYDTKMQMMNVLFAPDDI